MRRTRVQSRPSSELPTDLRRGGILAAGSVAASAFTTLCSLVATLLILRALSPNEAGRFAFLVELLYSVGMIGSLGQPVLQARIYQQMGATKFDWVRDAMSTVSATCPFVLAGVFALTVPYQLHLFEGVFLGLGAELFILVTCFSAVLGQQRRYAWSSALVRLGNGLLILPAILMLVRSSLGRLDFVLISLIVFLGIAAMLGAALLWQQLPRGHERITIQQRLSGLIFLASLLALLVPQRGLIVIAGAMLNPANVAALAALVSILRVFDLLSESAGRVFSTEMAQNPGQIGAGLIAAPLVLAGLLALALAIVLPPIAHRFYGGRYDVALPLLPWLVAAAALRFVEVVPRGFLAYLAPAGLLNRFASAQCLTAVAGIMLMVMCTEAYGMRGLVWAATLIAVVRLGISYVFLIPLRKAHTSSTSSAGNIPIEPLEPGREEPPV